MIAPETCIPPVLASYEDDRLWATHERLAAMNKTDMHAYLAMNDVQRFPDPQTAAFVDLRHDDADPTHAIVVPAPFANDWGVNLGIRMRLLHESMPFPTRLVVFPNNICSQPAYDLERKHKQRMKEIGTFEPIAGLQLRTLEKLGITRVQYMGYSQGASVGAAALRILSRGGGITPGDSGLFEAPNVVERSALQLRRDFMGTDGFAEVVNQSGIPMLSEEQCTRGGMDTVRQAARIACFGANSMLPVNRAIFAAFRHARFIDDIEIATFKLQGSAHLTVGRGTNSTIVPSQAMQAMKWRAALDNDRGLRPVEVLGYGHEMADNILIHTLLARMALLPTDLRQP